MKNSPRSLPWMLLIAAFALWIPSVAGSESANWPQWRGPTGTGVSEATIDGSWTAESTLLWKTELEGLGHSSPIIWDDSIFVTAAVEGAEIPGAEPVTHMLGDNKFVHPDSVGGRLEHTFKVISLDAASGKIRWNRTAYTGRVFDDRHKRSSYASPTAITDGERVYAYFGSQGVYAYDFDGNQIWKKDLGGIASLGVGVGSSPVLYNDRIILLCDQDSGDNSFMVALDSRTGKEAWRVDRPVQLSWGTPLLVTSLERPELITSGNEWIISYDPSTGRELWRLEGLKSNAVATPLASGDLLVVSSGYPQKITKAVRLGGSGDITGTDRVLWTYNKGTSYIGSYLLYGGRVYLFNDQGVMTALNAESGDVLYEGGRPPGRLSVAASPIVLGDRILMPSGDGDLFLVETGDSFKATAAGSIGEPLWASPAVAGGRLFLRGRGSLGAYRLK